MTCRNKDIQLKNNHKHKLIFPTLNMAGKLTSGQRRATCFDQLPLIENNHKIIKLRGGPRDYITK